MKFLIIKLFPPRVWKFEKDWRRTRIAFNVKDKDTTPKFV